MFHHSDTLSFYINLSHTIKEVIQFNISYLMSIKYAGTTIYYTNTIIIQISIHKKISQTKHKYTMKFHIHKHLNKSDSLSKSILDNHNIEDISGTCNISVTPTRIVRQLVIKRQCRDTACWGKLRKITTWLATFMRNVNSRTSNTKLEWADCLPTGCVYVFVPSLHCFAR